MGMGNERWEGEGRERKGEREVREKGGKARLGYLSRGAEFTELTPLSAVYVAQRKCR